MNEGQTEQDELVHAHARGFERLTIEAPSLLLVEGDDELPFFKALAKHLGLCQIQVINIQGENNLRPALDAVVKNRRFDPLVKSIGIELDAHDNPQAAFDKIRGALQNPKLLVKLPVPKRPLVTSTGPVKVTVMVLPDERTPGSFEDLCLRAFQGSPAMACADRFFECLDERGMPRPQQESKARMHVLLASEQEFQKHLGLAAFKDYWPWSDSAFDQVKSFLRQVAS